MFTQQDLLDRLNQLTLRHNLSWRDIKHDADKAISKINNFMGTLYPRMSEKLLSPTSTYTMRIGVIDVEIFPEQYIHSIVIPYIAMEILARDEEFTTIYNKYLAELEEGLFNMFSNEFNRVPLALRQQPDQGVFFATDSALAAIERNLKADLPIYKFRVKYHINNTAIILYEGESFPEDTHAYTYNEDATMLAGPVADLLSYDGAFAYKFKGWTRNPLTSSHIAAGEDVLPVDTVFKMTSDVNLYANWEIVSTLYQAIDSIQSGIYEVHIKAAYASSLTTLVVPDIVDGIMVKVIAPEFAIDAVNLKSITLPKYTTTIKNSAFFRFLGETIVLPETPLSPTYAGISIEANAFNDTPKLVYIVLPTNVLSIAASAFPRGATGSDVNIAYAKVAPLRIKARVLEQNKPVTWVNGWYETSISTYVVSVEWGYNG